VAPRPLASAIIGTLLCLVIATAAAARDCREETPLPPDVSLIAPAANVPAAIARFAGVWVGPWRDADSDILCATLVVEEVLPSGHARVVYSHGTWEPRQIRFPGYFQAAGRIVDGELRFALPVIGRPTPMAYRFTAEGLAGTYHGTGHHAAVRVPDLAGIGCRRRLTAISAPPTSGGPRDRLTASQLLAGTAAAAPVHNDYFLPVGSAGPARHALRGTLTIAAASGSGARDGCLSLPVPAPGFSVEVVTHGEHLVPVTRGVIGTAMPALVMSPGRVWSEPGDGGMSRASLPFIVMNPLYNEMYNGVATFVFDDTRVSGFHAQIVQETAPYDDRSDVWATSPMTYSPGAIAGEAALRARFDEEVRRRVPTRPWADLPAAVRDAPLGGVDGEAAGAAVSASGLVVDGVLHVRGCPTRHGPFPYCREMRHGVFSVTKSLGGAVALLRLAQKYGDTVFDAKIADYVTVTASHDGWKDVTFADVLGMATGIGEASPRREPNDVFADENRPRWFRGLAKPSLAEKLAVAFEYPAYPWRPGEVFRYNSIQPFVLAAAMDAFLKRREGPNAGLWDMLAREVLEPIGAFHVPMLRTIEADGSGGVPLLSYGLFLTVDDVAKLATLLQSGGQHEGQQILHPTKLAEALYRTSPDAGLPVGWKFRAGAARYHLSFWSMPYRTAAGCFVQIPFLWGYGGNHVVLLPNGVTTFRFTDVMPIPSPNVEGMILAGEAVRPLCAPAVAAVTGPPPVPLTAAEVTGLLAGQTLQGDFSRITIDRSGTLTFESTAGVDVGRWHVTGDGRFCRAWHVGDRRRLRCHHVHRDGEDIELRADDRWSVIRFRRVPAP
jgi:beta-lactamase family protein